MKKKIPYSYETKDQMLKHLKRIEGQVRGLGRMITEDIYCDDILHQFASVEASLNSVRYILLESHIRTCVVGKIQEDKLKIIDELMRTIKKIN